LRALGRVGLRTLLCTALFSAIAVAIGVTLVNWIRPGDGLDAAARAALGPLETAPAMAKAPSAKDFFVGMVPQNPLRAMADGDMLAVMVFALFLGIGIAGARSPAVTRFSEALQGLYEVTMRLLGFVIAAAPVGVACLMFTLTARLGYDVLGLLAAYVVVALLGLALQQFVVYALAVKWLGGMRPLDFFRGVRTAMLTAFSTSSSNATLPTSLAVAEQELRLPPQISRFVLTVGSTANQNGTALFEGVTVLFLAQFFGVELSLAQQLSVVGICILGGIGTAGVPAGSLPVIAMILGMIGVPPEGIGLILGVDRLLDMCRTVVNVTGDLAVAVVVSSNQRAASARAV
jgi:DAACS family dicarboxylate/amino acid:cation (Na+ or H+) symporter